MSELAANHNDLDDDLEDDDEEPSWRRIREKMSHEELFWTRDYSDTPTYQEVHKPQYQLRDTLVDIQRYANLIHVQLPVGMGGGGLSDYHYFSQMIRLIWSGMIDQFTENTRDNLIGKQYHRTGEFSIDQNGTATVELSIRKSPFPIAEEEVAKAVYYEGASLNGDYDWTYYHYNQECYPVLIRPYVENQYPGTANPFDWACSRTEIAAGFATAMGFINECPPRYLAAPFKRIARNVCNTVPESMLEPRKYPLNLDSKGLITAARQLFGKNFCPETACLLLENADSFNCDMLYDSRVIALLESLPTYVENGLIIDRLSQLFQQLVEHGTPEPRALQQSLEIIASIYGQGKNPWWFKEDIDFTTLIDKQDPAASVEQLQKMAQAAGHAFIYAWELYQTSGKNLVQSSRIDQDTAINICARIATRYGIGNLERAKSVLEFAEEIINNTPLALVKQSLAHFLEHIEETSPTCEILSKMEGQESIIDFPGLTMLFIHGIGREACEAAQLDKNTINPQTIQQLTTYVEQPLAQRAKDQPSTEVEARKTLLTPHIDVARLLTTGTSIETAPLATSQPEEQPVLNKVLQFYAKLRAECGYTNGTVAGIYFAMCSSKMPDPLNPPDGFLRFLQKWDQLPVHGYSLPYFHHPFERDKIARRNAMHSVEKQTFLIDILDLWLMGYLKDERELMLILEWMTEEATDETKAEITAQVRDKELRREKQFKAEDPDYKARSTNLFEEDVKLYAGSKIRDIEVEVWKDRAAQASTFLFKAVQVAYMASIGLLKTGTAQNYIRDLIANLPEQTPFKSKEDDQYTFAIDTSIGDLIKYNVIDEEKLRECLALHPEQTLPLIEAVLELMTKCKETSDLIAQEKEARQNGEVEESQRIAERRVKIALIWESLSQEIINTLGDILNPDFLAQIIHFETRFELLLWMARTHTVNSTQKVGYSPTYNVEAITTFTANLIASVTTITRGDTHLLPANTNPEQGIEKLQVDYGTRIKAAIPNIRRQIEAVREKAKGLLPVGGKIHVLHPINEDKLNRFLNAFGFNSTGFKLIHANRSLCLPVLSSAEELELIVSALEELQIINRDQPELQMSIPGRLPPQPKPDIAILASAVLLATERGKEEYDKDAFCTNRDHQTGARIMAYDAGQPNIEMPDMWNLQGRTDMLGRRALSDIKLYQQLGTILVQRHIKKGLFAHLADEFEQKYRQILRDHDMEDILNESWIFDQADDRRDNKASEKHYQTVKRCTDAYRDCAQQYHESQQAEGIIFEVRDLFDWLEENISIIQKTL